jgi:hypothetical protein
MSNNTDRALVVMLTFVSLKTNGLANADPLVTFEAMSGQVENLQLDDFVAAAKRARSLCRELNSFAHQIRQIAKKARAAGL